LSFEGLLGLLVVRKGRPNNPFSFKIKLGDAC